MPQLDLGTYPSQIFWLVVTFVPLYIFIWRVALPRIAEVLEARQDKISDDLEVAAERKQEAEAVLADYETAKAKALSDAHAVIGKAKDQMKEEAAQASAELAEKLKAESVAAEARIAGAKQQALANLDASVAEAVSAATSKLIGVTPSAAQVQAAVGSSTGGER